MEKSLAVELSPCLSSLSSGNRNCDTLTKLNFPGQDFSVLKVLRDRVFNQFLFFWNLHFLFLSYKNSLSMSFTQIDCSSLEQHTCPAPGHPTHPEARSEDSRYDQLPMDPAAPIHPSTMPCATDHPKMMDDFSPYVYTWEIPHNPIKA